MKEKFRASWPKWQLQGLEFEISIYLIDDTQWNQYPIIGDVAALHSAVRHT